MSFQNAVDISPEGKEFAPVESRNTLRKAIGAVAVLALTGTAAAAYTRSAPASFTGAALSSTEDDSVKVYIVAESMCPNCKEHSALFDEHIMSKGQDMREILDIQLDMMLIDGWDSVKQTGICEKGKWDCKLGQFQLASQHVAETSKNQWWDFNRCLFKNQPALIEYYVPATNQTQEYMNSVASKCADEANLSFDEIKDKVDNEGNKLLYDAYARDKEFDDPVWIKVNDMYVEYEADWLATICSSYTGSNTPQACIDHANIANGTVSERSASLFENSPSEKVDVYIVAEAFCPNCKEHSYYFDKLVMTPENVMSGMRSIMNIYMEQMVLEGWDYETNTGICEKGKYDCLLSKYNLCSQSVYNSTHDTSAHIWWDFVRCTYEHQPTLVETYYYDGSDDSTLMDTVIETCASKASVDLAAIKSCATGDEGTQLLFNSYKYVSEMNMPVWIYVNGQKIAYHEDWKSAICAAYTGSDAPEECDEV